MQSATRHPRRPLAILALFCVSVLLGLSGARAAEPAVQTAIFAGGCFWCMEAEFSGVKGVSKVVSGFTGGTTPNPTYGQVSSGATGHVESIQVTYDPAIVTYEKLVGIFWENIDPLDANGQFCDKGSQYHAGIFYMGDEQKKVAEASLEKVKAKFTGQTIATVIRPASEFYPAEEYHQGFFNKNRIHYTMYRNGCGRDARLHEVWQGKEINQ